MVCVYARALFRGWGGYASAGLLIFRAKTSIWQLPEQEGKELERGILERRFQSPFPQDTGRFKAKGIQGGMNHPTTQQPQPLVMV